MMQPCLISRDKMDDGASGVCEWIGMNSFELVDCSARWMGARWMGARWMGARWMGEWSEEVGQMILLVHVGTTWTCECVGVYAPRERVSPESERVTRV